MKFHSIDFKTADWKRLDGFADRTVFQTREWVKFVSESQNAAPVLAELREGSDVIGYFTGLTLSKFGLKVLGSSFPGWTTPYIGFNLEPGVSRHSALEALEKFAWNDLKCLHMEISDAQFNFEDAAGLGFKAEFYGSYRTDLSKSEDDLFNSMESACRRCVRKAEKSGVKIEEAHDLAFADEYYEQLKDVFAKQSLVPTYSVERVRSLVRKMEPTLRYWKQRGVSIFDWGGEGTYKEKYGCTPYRVPWFTKSRYQIVGALRNEARNMFARKQKFLGWLQGSRTGAERPAED